MKKALITCAIVGGLLASYPALSTDQAASDKSAGKGGYHHAQQKLKVVEDLYAGFFNRHDIGVAQKLIVENYKQHNPFVGDGIKPFWISSARPLKTIRSTAPKYTAARSTAIWSTFTSNTKITRRIAALPAWIFTG